MDISLFKIFGEYGSYVVFGAISAWMIIDTRLQSNKLIQTLSDKLDWVRLAVGRKTYTPEETLIAVREKIWFASIEKLDYIRQILVNNHISERKEEVTTNIRSKLEELSQKYIEEFNLLNTPIERLWDAVADNFEFEPFFKEIMDIVFRSDNNHYVINMKIKDIESVMRKYQTKMSKKLSAIMSKKCNNCFANAK